MGLHIKETQPRQERAYDQEQVLLSAKKIAEKHERGIGIVRIY